MAGPERNGAQLDVEKGGDGTLTLVLRGRLAAESIARVWERGRRALRQRPGARVQVDASGVTYCDGAGAAMLVDFDRTCARTGGRLELRDFPEAFQPILDLVRPELREPPAAEPCPPWESVATFVGRRTVELLRDARSLVGFVGEVTVAMLHAILFPHRVRWRDVLRAMQTTGVDAFPVVMLVSALLGLILSYQSADILHRFGADVFLPFGLALSIVRELGPLMTAIVLTARSGSAFAAEIGTMKVNEEVDALSTMGLDPTRFLVTPRLIAAVLVTPVLTVFANLAGLVGGTIVGTLQLGLPLVTCINEMRKALDLTDLFGGLFKALVFGTLVAAIGCHRGMQTSGGAVGVGAATTSAVVSGIVLIALADAVLAVVYYHLGL
ncbi:MAG TPA: MlaE family lipid ABC transporter permease subunit [Planctomycetota bacterium]|nr:MlaE family lipid ABC transporter permease subunit [Planctomycetota bacterium]